MMRRTWIRTLTVLALLGVVGTPLLAQQNRGSRGERDREELMERIRARMAAMIQDRLELSDEESASLSVIVQDFERRRIALARQERETRRQVEELDLSNPDDSGAAALLEQMVELRRQEMLLYEEELDALLEVLTPSQVLELQSLRADMGRRIRSLRGGDERNGRRGGDSRRRRRGGGGGPDSGGASGVGGDVGVDGTSGLRGYL